MDGGSSWFNNTQTQSLLNKSSSLLLHTHSAHLFFSPGQFSVFPSHSYSAYACLSVCLSVCLPILWIIAAHWLFGWLLHIREGIICWNWTLTLEKPQRFAFTVGSMTAAWLRSLRMTVKTICFPFIATWFMGGLYSVSSASAQSGHLDT